MKKKSLKLNVTANFASKIWNSGLTIISVPIYVHFLGIEAYGLVGLFGSLQVIFNFLDLGISATVTREVARNLALDKSQENKVLLRTFETIYWIVGLLIALSLIAASSWIATRWGNAQKLPLVDIKLAIWIMAISFAARWPIALYSGVLQGLQEQVLQNAVVIGAGTFRTLGGLIVIWSISPSIKTFLLWQALSNALEVFVHLTLTWRIVYRGSKSLPSFDVKVIKSVWRFALSYNVISAIGLILSQGDKVIIGWYVSLEQLGYYSVAVTAAGILYLLPYAIVGAISPRFSSLIATTDLDSISKDFQKTLHIVSFISAPLVAAMGVYAFEILTYWTGNVDVAKHSAIVLAILALAGFFNAVQSLCYSILIAEGKVKAPLIANIACVVIGFPIMIGFLKSWGIIAAAVIWLAENIAFYIIYTIAIRHVLGATRSVLGNILSGFMYLPIACICYALAHYLIEVTSLLSLATSLILAGCSYFLLAMLVKRLRIISINYLYSFQGASNR